ncbi:hypothetical protein GCM10007916_24090 [Psychromonas marina]|uniref:Solute-binding protein family 3/N-terminal domain-containing protein n=1 Tax=Psychromonas marina TaxID=88364 RepID=A0ABQ6E2A5_9GAMM|nr:hypothetical protein [Psychromonas marina]GLS91340.1 hypothetical protein GCM10007916_24090 [Psychromonas marina]
MKKLSTLLVLISITLSSFAAHTVNHEKGAERNELLIIIPADVKDDYDLFVNGRDPLKIKDFGGQYSRRDVVEVLLTQQALYLGGMLDPIQLTVSPSHARMIKQVRSGAVVMSGNSIWHDAFNKSDFAYVSDAIIEDGMFEAGIYTTPTNQNTLQAKTLSDIQRLTAVSSKAWLVDWQTLNSMEMSSLINTVKWSSMVKMVARGRADFLLAPFQPTDDMSFIVDGVHLVPVPGIKVGLKGTRHFAVSKQHARGKDVIQALNKGIKILKEQGVVNQAYIDSGFFNAKVKNWENII